MKKSNITTRFVPYSSSIEGNSIQVPLNRYNNISRSFNNHYHEMTENLLSGEEHWLYILKLQFRYRLVNAHEFPWHNQPMNKCSLNVFVILFVFSSFHEYSKEILHWWKATFSSFLQINHAHRHSKQAYSGNLNQAHLPDQHLQSCWEIEKL